MRRYYGTMAAPTNQGLITEAGLFIITESGDYIVTEAFISEGDGNTSLIFLLSLMKVGYNE